MSKTVKKKFKIEGMHCSSCAMCIDMDLEDLEGVYFCQTSYAKAETEVEYDEFMVKIELIIQSIKKSGYSAGIIE